MINKRVCILFTTSPDVTYKNFVYNLNQIFFAALSVTIAGELVSLWSEMCDERAMSPEMIIEADT